MDSLVRQAEREVTITAEMVADARSKGVSHICAHCELFWEGILKRGDRCMALINGQPCGSVFVGLAFPEYKGPLDPAAFPTICFVCGQEAVACIEAATTPGKMLGVCGDHLRWIEKEKARREIQRIGPHYDPGDGG